MESSKQEYSTLREWMYKNDITQSGMAKEMGVNETHLCAIVSGRKPAGVRTAYKIFKYTDGAITLESLLDGSAASKPLRR